MNLKTKTLMTAALGGLMFATTVSVASAEEAGSAPTTGTKMGQCHGINSCKGTGACHSADTSCAGTNACKGKGWLRMAKTDCDAKGGTFKE
jgi:hypothetical protein